MPPGKPLQKGAPPTIKAHFESTPAFSRLFSDPTLEALGDLGYDPPSTHNTFIGKTLSTDDTIIASQSFRNRPQPGTNEHFEVVTVLSIGSGVNGHSDVCHGGFVSVLLDEALGAAAEQEHPPDKSAMTAYLNVNYKKPVMTPSNVLCRGIVKKTDGRKMWLEGLIEDDKGVILASAEALFIIIEKTKALEKL
ncbi:uncharacterized protein BP5553_02167 [Venustampulla echinocandica]|uniref:Thioesterase domain-containing protein n=1 Tax=Venustampulla echinocandica TaxID=2656787 RepID=A0A370U333_9HELO|nr:uncharacterized protein BP5553_02167 [Venustampulla echinocandica]RDL42188.1 hypothetical protein BP5553_02167 [Venustampulla echinocandica]